MTELEVEAVDPLDAGVAADTPEYVLYGGKGGVGKTTMAAATGLASASDGVSTLVVSTDPAHSLSDALETDVPAEPTRLREDEPLYGVEIDPDEALAETPLFDEDGDLGALGGLGDLLGGGPGAGDAGAEGSPGGGQTDAPLGGPMPGADEAAAVQQLLRYLDDDRFERVVVDTAPTGHTLRLLELPEIMDSMLGRVVSMRQRLQGAWDSVAGAFGGGDPGEGGPDLDAVRERIERLRATLRDPDRTDFRAVMVPEEMSVLETGRLCERLDAAGIPVETLVVNRVMEDLADVADVEPDAVVRPDLENCEFCQRRWSVQQRALAEAQELFRGRDVRRVPLFAEEVRGERTLRVVGACLA